MLYFPLRATQGGGGIFLIKVILCAARRFGTFPGDLEIESMIPGVGIFSA